VTRATITISLVIEAEDEDGLDGVMEAVDRALDAGTIQDAIVSALEDADGKIVSATSNYAAEPEPKPATVETVECPHCKRRPDEVNHPTGMIFVGWGRGWETCGVCGGTTRVKP
jgi:hypothetical protein